MTKDEKRELAHQVAEAVHNINPILGMLLYPKGVTKTIDDILDANEALDGGN